MLHANTMALRLTERKLLLIEVLHCRIRNFRCFWLLWPWPDDLHIRTRPVDWLGRYTACANVNFLRQGFQKLSSDRHTYRQTDRHDQNYTPHHFVGRQKTRSYKDMPHRSIHDENNTHAQALRTLYLQNCFAGLGMWSIACCDPQNRAHHRCWIAFPSLRAMDLLQPHSYTSHIPLTNRVQQAVVVPGCRLRTYPNKKLQFCKRT